MSFIPSFHTMNFLNVGRWDTNRTLLDLEKVLVDVGAVKLGDSRLERKKDDEDGNHSKIRQGNTAADDEDSDWD